MNIVYYTMFCYNLKEFFAKIHKFIVFYIKILIFKKKLDTFDKKMYYLNLYVKTRDLFYQGGKNLSGRL